MSRIIPSTHQRVRKHSSPEANERIRTEMPQRLKQYEAADESRISMRIRELEQEWDIERVLEANAASVALTGLVLGATVDRRWFALPAVVAGFLLQACGTGVVSPLPVFRRLGVRTAAEIHEEIIALKVMRGDFGQRQGDTDQIVRQASLH